MTVALENREYVFAYLDLNEDKDLINNLNILHSNFPKVLIYSSEYKRIYVDEFVYNEEKVNMLHLKILVKKLKQGEIKFKSSFWLEDQLENLGIKINRKTLTILCVILFAIVILIFVVNNFFTYKKIEKKEKHDDTIKAKNE